ncbi:MAG: SRPBCC family protein [Halobacteriovoraceae bacterium]|nr:SRPBCC family protein [Halobacteriovoraceae bacterium]MCB9095178.1 SRPBCC family protein [Halobacteriovoraceae bacterium]
MPAVEKTETFNAPIEKIFAAIEDFGSYHEYVDGVEKIDVLEKSETAIKAEYFLNLIKEFRYIINVKLDRPTHVEWSLESGDLFKKNNGYWDLEKIDENTTRVTYGLDVEFKMFAPKMIVNKLVKSNLPQMMEAFHKRAKQL